jgi:TPR repeat protein
LEIAMATQEQFQQLVANASAGDPQAQYDLAMLYSDGPDGIPQNGDLAAHWMLRAAEQSYPRAEWMLGVWYENGTNVAHKPGTGRALMIRAAEAGLPDASLGLYYRTQEDKEQGPLWLEKAKAHLGAAARNGDEVAAANLGMLLLNTGVAAEQRSEAAPWLMFLADGGHPGAQFTLAVWLLEGTGVPYDRNRALTYVNQAAAAGDPRAEALREVFNLVAIGDHQEWEAYIGLLRMAAERCNPEAQAALGFLSLHGIGVQQSARQAKEHFRAAAEEGNLQAEFALGRIYYGTPPIDISPSEAAKWLKRAANRGHLGAQYDLAVNYHRYYANRDGRLAAFWYRKAAEAGHAGAQIALGQLYDQRNEYDRTVEKDNEQAFHWYAQAAGQGHAYGQLCVAQMLEEGRGVERDYERAMAGYRKALEEDGGHSDVTGAACVGLGRLFERGLGVPQDYEQAARWYRRGVENAHDEAYLHLGRLYEAGRGVPVDISEAIKWYLKAAWEEVYWHEISDDVTKEAIVRLGRLEEKGHKLPYLQENESHFRNLYPLYRKSTLATLVAQDAAQDDVSRLEPSLSEGPKVTGLEPEIRLRHVNLGGVHLTLSSYTAFSEKITEVVPTPDEGKPVLVFGAGPFRYEKVDLASGARQVIPLPAKLMLVALDDVGRYYLLEGDSRTLHRYTADFKEDLSIALQDQRDVSIGRDGNIYTWLFRSREMEVYNPAGQQLRVLEHGWSPYSLAVDEHGGIWIGEAAMSHVVEISPSTGETLRYLDPKEDFTAENLFCYTYAMNFDRRGDLWTFNGQGDVGSTIISPDKTQFLRFASKDLGLEYIDSEPVPSPWHDEVYFVSGERHVSLFGCTLRDWMDITPDIHRQT